MSFEFHFSPVNDVDDECLAQFDCGNEDLRSFLLDDSKDYANHGVTKTTVVWLSSDHSKPAAFFSLSNDVVRLTLGETGELGLPFNPVTNNFPAIKLTKFAVHREHHRTGLSYELIKYIEGLVFAANGISAVRLLTLDALPEEQVLAFYGRNGFMECESDARERKHQKRRQRHTIPMYKDIFV